MLSSARRSLLAATAAVAVALPLLLAASRAPVPRQNAAASDIPPSAFASLHWRLIGPYRAGKVTSVAGDPHNPAVYYFGSAGGGAWKTSDGGTTWHNVTDGVRLTGIGSVYLAPSRPATVYVGTTGGGQPGGLYRSTDAGASFERVALAGDAVPSLLIDPKNADVVMAASTPGVLRTTDGGAHWTTVLPHRAVNLAFDPDNPQTVYAAVLGAFGGRGGRAGRGTEPADPAAPVIYRSNDNGATWTPTNVDTLPTGNYGTIGLAVAPGTNGQRVFAYLSQGLWRSDNGGASWTRATTDPRLIGGGQFHTVYVDPSNANEMFAMQTSCYRSMDAGNTWESYTGAPSGADFNALWISPVNDLNMILGVDQGAGISMNGGISWTTWYNQPTGQLYNVTTDHQFPFFMYSSQQDSGTVAVPIFGNDGEITYRDWYTTNGFESAKITADPVHHNILFVTGWYGSILRVDHTTGQSVHVFERNPDYHEAGSPPMEFNVKSPGTLYLGTQYLLATTDAGLHWHKASPDLTVVPGRAAASPPPGRGGRGAAGAAISTIAPSPLNGSVIWAGTTNGLIQLSQNAGTTWANVTPPGPTSSVTMIEPGHHLPGVAFAVMAGRGGGRGAPAVTAVPAEAPPIFKTKDFGKTWTPINSGLTGSVRALRQDIEDPNLLFAINDTSVFVSFNAGDAWQDMDLNLPAASRRDLALEQNDLILATYGRGLWALDDIGMLRQLTPAVAAAPVHFFAPTPAYRKQWDTYTDTPISPERAHSDNPPDGAILDYSLASPPSGDITLDITDAFGKLVRHFSSSGPTTLPYKVNVPDYWLSPPDLLPKTAGHNRFVWNLRYPDPPYLLYTYFGVHSPYYEYTLADHAIPGNTPWHEPQGPLVVPGIYHLTLTVGGTVLKQALQVKLDPRLTTITQADLTHQLAVAQFLSSALESSTTAYNQVDAVRKQAAAASLQTTLNQIAEAGFGSVNRDQARFLTSITQADAPPAQEVIDTINENCRQYNTALARWAAFVDSDLKTTGITPPTSQLPLLNCDLK